MSALRRSLILMLVGVTLAHGKKVANKSIAKDKTNHVPPVYSSEQSDNLHFTPKIPVTCEHECYCNSVFNYPEAHAIYLLQKLLNVSLFGTNNELPLMKQNQNVIKTPSIIPLCSTIPTNIIPQAVRNEKGEWVFVLNPRNSIVHSFKVQLCRNLTHSYDKDSVYQELQYMSKKTSGTCKSSVVTFGGDYRAYCYQNYIYVLLYTLNPDGDLQQNWHKLPSGCSCEAEYKFYY